jgi:glutathione synthase/RimK-type ligase-like ATP-grasp enzyme
MLDSLRSTLWARKLYRRRWFMALKNYAKFILPRTLESYPQVDDRDQLDSAEKVLITWPEHCPKPRVGLMCDQRNYPYWTKFERFLKNNQIPFDYYEAHRSNWLAAAGQFDIILWVPEWSIFYVLEEMRRKAYILEKFCGKVCFPSFDTLMWEEDKLTQYELLRMNNFPLVETFISHDLREILKKLSQLEYPLVAKSSIGAGSMTVELVKDSRQAERITKTIFSRVGRMTFLPYFRQKNYVYFQKFQPNEGYDLRVIVVGNIVMGYYRDVPKGEFRASGMETLRWEAIPEDAIKLGREVARKFGEVVMAVDMLRDSRDRKLYITELGAAYYIDFPGDLIVDGVKGIYVFNSLGEYNFQPGVYWTQELILREFFEKKWFKRSIRSKNVL